MRYIVLSPVGDHRKKYLAEFLGAVRKLKPAPEQIVLCIDFDSDIEINAPDVTVKINADIDCYRGHLKRICSAREILRKHFIYHPQNYEWALWIDSDIMVPPETVQTLRQKMDENNCLIVVNKYDGRSNGEGGRRQWCGSGVMLTHRHACTASRFWVGNIIDQKGVEKHLSEDFVFFAIFDQGGFLFKMWTDRKGRVCDEYVKVRHLMEKRRNE